MSDFAIDPYTQVYDRIWELLEAEASLMQLVKPGNRVNLQDRNPSPRKSNTQDGDLPELSVMPMGGGVDLWKTNTTAIFDEVYRIAIATGDLRPHKQLNPIKFAVLRALGRTANDLGLPFVVTTNCMSVTDTLYDLAQNRGTVAWSALYDVRVTMKIPRAVLLGTAQ